MTPHNRVTRLIHPEKLKQELNESIDLFREQLQLCTATDREGRALFYGSAHGLLSALYVAGLIDQAEYQPRNAKLRAEFLAGRI